MGEDVGRYGGAFAVSHGLLEEFGPERIRDTPLSESAFVGAGIGAALGGMRPIVEVMTVNFSLLALDQIVNNAATLRHMSGGQLSVPLVVRMATGGGRQLAAQHSHSLEGWYAHIPGIKVLAPATISDARAMLSARSAIPTRSSSSSTRRSTPPRARSTSGVPTDIRSAAVRREGTDVSLVTYGGSVAEGARSGRAARRGVDLGRGDRPARPPSAGHADHPRLGREDPSRGRHRRGVADGQLGRRGERADHGGRVLRARPAVARVCSAEVPIPYAKHLEDAALPRVDTIVATARTMLGRDG